ncbi:DUF2808 domain-containing protein [Aerosakkonemataceae cyanobacterium BLCC-F154]|uniref:DUF2808 domain-containing protein n=1 Tax=Floridaenema fluviatile BLCC-F154 TaxID=3153640 RepID=A0ABV4YLC6_9CYAN
MFLQFSFRRTLTALAVTSCLLTGTSSIVSANGLPGFTLWGGPPREAQLPFRLDFGGRVNVWDRYRLKIPDKKMKLAVSQFAISYPEYFKGTFDTKDVEVKVEGKSVEIDEVTWDKENRTIQIFPTVPVPAGKDVELVLSNVKNPSSGGMFYFNCSVMSPGDVPLMRYLGTWLLSID